MKPQEKEVTITNFIQFLYDNHWLICECDLPEWKGNCRMKNLASAVTQFFSQPEKEDWKIYFHGTSAKNAKQIVKEGFKKQTHFADHLENALGCGGNHIFEVAIAWKNRSKEKSWDWQIRSANKISKKWIVNYSFYPKRKAFFNNEKLRDKIFKSNL